MRGWLLLATLSVVTGCLDGGTAPATGETNSELVILDWRTAGVASTPDGGRGDDGERRQLDPYLNSPIIRGAMFWGERDQPEATGSLPPRSSYDHFEIWAVREPITTPENPCDCGDDPECLGAWSDQNLGCNVCVVLYCDGGVRLHGCHYCAAPAVASDSR